LDHKQITVYLLLNQLSAAERTIIQNNLGLFNVEAHCDFLMERLPVSVKIILSNAALEANTNSDYLELQENITSPLRAICFLNRLNPTNGETYSLTLTSGGIAQG